MDDKKHHVVLDRAFQAGLQILVGDEGVIVLQTDEDFPALVIGSIQT